ncbi:nucleoporin Nup43 [Biomphalaria pfeifferi]|uniref:Nucleoporin Nup43 n=1 Tax=Biomphalaria pfeifferi TaxID=112525 RepID=A0AAD8EXZ2_BIOPF|nr:nucleoporin Nup43 [Biomphalaria pfeifferi]
MALCSKGLGATAVDILLITPLHSASQSDLPAQTLQSLFLLPGKDSTRQGEAIVSPWLSLETSRHKLDISSLLPNKSLPVNSLDIDTSTLLCGTDSETIYSVQLPMLD